MTFQPLSESKRKELAQALKANGAHENGGVALLMDPKDTTFKGTAPVDEIPDEEVIAAIRSVPCHY